MEKKLQVTTQSGIRTVLHLSLSQRLWTNEQALRYQRLPHNVFGDTLVVGTTSKRGNKYAELFTTNFGWTRAFTMERKSKAHEALSLIFQRDGVLPWMIVDGLKEKVEGDCSCKCKESGCYLEQTESYSLWQNTADGVIK